MENTLEIKKYEKRIEKDLNGDKFYVLSFSSGSHLKVSEKAMKIIELLNGRHKNSEIVDELNLQGTQITLKELEYFIFEFLLPKNVLVGKDTSNTEINSKKLWFHLPLIESNKFSFLYKFLKILLSKPLVIIMITLIVICVILSSIFLLNYEGSFINEVSSIQILLLVYFSMFIHEIGHATAAHKYGISVGKIGIGIYLIYFIFFIDMTNTWKLNKKERIVNDLSGVYFQTILIVFIFATYLVTHNISLLCAILIILCTSLMNFMPFLRMDGYWLLSDYLSMQNVQMKSISSIKAGFKEFKKIHIARKSNELYMVDKQVMFYSIYSLVYVTSTVIMLSFISISVMKIITNIDDVIIKCTSLYISLIQGNINSILLDLNNLFILILPLLFVFMLVFSTIKKSIKLKLIRRKVR